MIYANVCSPPREFCPLLSLLRGFDYTAREKEQTMGCCSQFPTALFPIYSLILATTTELFLLLLVHCTPFPSMNPHSLPERPLDPDIHVTRKRRGGRDETVPATTIERGADAPFSQKIQMWHRSQDPIHRTIPIASLSHEFRSKHE